MHYFFSILGVFFLFVESVYSCDPLTEIESDGHLLVTTVERGVVIDLFERELPSTPSPSTNASPNNSDDENKKDIEHLTRK